MSIKVLVVEDDARSAACCATALAAEGFEVATAVSVSEATALLAARSAGPASSSTSACPTATAPQLVRAVRSTQRDADHRRLGAPRGSREDPPARRRRRRLPDEAVRRRRAARAHARRAAPSRHDAAAGATRYARASLLIDVDATAGRARRRAGAPDADRVQAARAPGAQRRPRRHAPPAAGRRVGRRARRRHALPAPLHGPAARQARGASRPSRATCSPRPASATGSPSTEAPRAVARLCVPDVERAYNAAASPQQRHDHERTTRGARAWPALTLGAIGVVYGDIGTSPLYTMQGDLRPRRRRAARRAAPRSAPSRRSSGR